MSQQHFQRSSDKQLLRQHKEWLGYLQPVGLVLAPHVLLRHAVVVQLDIKTLTTLQDKLRSILQFPDDDDQRPFIPNFATLASILLNWKKKTDFDIVDPNTPDLRPPEVNLKEYGEILRPSYLFFDDDDDDDYDDDDYDAPMKAMILIQELPRGMDMDQLPPDDTFPWKASPQTRLERLLRETNHSIGLLFNGTELRLVYAPTGESSGYITFPFDIMLDVQARIVLSALFMLLSSNSLLQPNRQNRLPALLEESRLYQNEVSTKLADQVLHAFDELLKGFQQADSLQQEPILSKISSEELYGGILTTILRLVFLLYAEDRGMMPNTELYLEYYSVSNLFQRLRDDAGLHPDTIDQRFGAWTQLLTLFRLVFTGTQPNSPIPLPERKGQLFDPDNFPFLEGRPPRSHWHSNDPFSPPKISDGTIFRILQSLLIIDGEKISYRSLDVEQIGSVYESMMGFSIQCSEGPSIALKPNHVVINLEELLLTPAKDRKKRLKEWADCDISGATLSALKKAQSIEEILQALQKKISPKTPQILPNGTYYLHPSEERRRSGSHYTPRVLTEPLVKKTLKPILERLGPHPTPEQILDLKICDPAMGSGAFLVETCRQLAQHLFDSWQFYPSSAPSLSPLKRKKTSSSQQDADLLLHARRLVAQHCLYGVDKNPFAVDLAKLSLWLITLDKDKPFTFLDHALKTGDSLLGLSKLQIEQLDWNLNRPETSQLSFNFTQKMNIISSLRTGIHSLSDFSQQKNKWKEAEDELHDIRFPANIVLSAFFSSSNKKERFDLLTTLQTKINLFREQSLSAEELKPFLNPALSPFHWEIEFPEVFQRENAGFDAFVGNPPFAGKNTLLNSNPEHYLDWLKLIHPQSHGNADLVAHFFRRAFHFLRKNGTMGFIATNTIAQGDTRTTGLRWICKHGGTIYDAQTRIKWPNKATVIVSTINIVKGSYSGKKVLNSRTVEKITAFLFHAGGDDDPKRLPENQNKSFQGSVVLGMGFTFDDTDKKGIANSLEEMRRLIRENPRNKERIFPYIGGKEVNTDPAQKPHRYVINLGTLTEEEARSQYPDLLAILERKVKPERMKLKDNADGRRRKKYWWLFGRYTEGLEKAIQGLERVLVISEVTTHVAFSFQKTNQVFAHTLKIIIHESYSAFAILQSRIHEIWARFFGSSLGDGLRYTPSDCFETFPFPEGWEENEELGEIGEEYYRYRAELMLKKGEGLTQIYNRFHDVHEKSEEIEELRRLHEQMDRAVLKAYGWEDLQPHCDFYLEYEEEETSSKKKKPWRYRWAQETHDEILARLFALNELRAQMQQQQTSEKKSPKKKRKKTSKNMALGF